MILYNFQDVSLNKLMTCDNSLAYSKLSYILQFIDQFYMDDIKEQEFEAFKILQGICDVLYKMNVVKSGLGVFLFELGI